MFKNANNYFYLLKEIPEILNFRNFLEEYDISINFKSLIYIFLKTLY